MEPFKSKMNFYKSKLSYMIHAYVATWEIFLQVELLGFRFSNKNPLRI
jgi:hypothetical protein